MTVLDANILLYAYNADAPEHATAARWLENLFAGPELIGLPWITIWAFLRISTNPRLWTRPKSTGQAFDAIRQWLAQPGVVVLGPGPHHSELLETLVTQYRATGPLVTDAVLAALVHEHGAILASTDRDFSRSPELRWINPLEESSTGR